MKRPALLRGAFFYASIIAFTILGMAEFFIKNQI